MAQQKPKSFLDNIKSGKHKQELKKVPENEIHYVAPFSSPADIIVYEKQSDTDGDLIIGPKSATHKANHDFLESCNVKCIISLSRTPIEEEFKLSDVIDYHYYEAKDEQNFDISKLFNAIHSKIDENISKGKTVLVHCDQGVSRSGAIIVSYLMKTLNLPFKDALALAKKSRSAIRPNEGFIKQLQQFEKQCSGSVSNTAKQDAQDETKTD